MTQPGTITATIDANTVTDAANNPNNASTSTDNTITYDNQPPTVTIDQATTQNDPTNTTPVTYTATFNEPVTGLTPTDITIGGTAGATTATITGGPTTYTITIDGMSQSGGVTVAMADGAATDASGNGSLPAATSIAYLPDDPNPLVNDAPTIAAPTADTVELGERFEFVDGNLISFADIDAAGADVTITVAAPAGTLTLASSDGLTDVVGDGTATVAFTGDLSAVNAAIDGLMLESSTLGPVAITVTIDDLGHTPGPPQSATANIVVTVVDTLGPVITGPPSPLVVPADPGQPGAVVTFALSVADNGVVTTSNSPTAPNRFTEVVEVDRITCSPASATFFPIGSTTVTCVATDQADNTSSIDFDVVVTDEQSPTLAASSPLTVATADGSGAVVTYPVPVGGDNSGSVSVVCTPPSGSLFAVGDTPVTCTATDPAGNTTVSSFTVTVTGPGVLPATGSTTSTPLTLAIRLILAGVAILFLSRRRRRRLGPT